MIHYSQSDSSTVETAIDATLHELYPDLCGTRHFTELRDELARRRSDDYGGDQQRFIQEFLAPVRSFLLTLRNSSQVSGSLLLAMGHAQLKLPFLVLFD